MHHDPLLQLGALLVLGIGATLFAHLLRTPSILLLLILGIVAGPVLGFIDPDAMLGEMLLPFVSLAVAAILFEGGLSLRFAELREVGGLVRNMVTLGVGIVWLLSATAAHWVLGLEFNLALLVGAITVVTGPTVVVPLLRSLSLTKRVASALKWEGIWNDPIGAALTVLVFQALFLGAEEGLAADAAKGVLIVLGLGAVLGLAGAALVVLIEKRHWAPDYLRSPVTLAILILVYLISDELHSESGLLTATVMGVALANQRFVAVRHIVEFKESLGVILISTVFILLAARLDMADIRAIGPATVLYLFLLLFVIRPLTVAICAMGSPANWSERLFIGWIAPRGIVAAAVASLFAERLHQLGHPQADRVVPVIFALIIATVTLHSLSAPFLARLLGIAQAAGQGVLMVGAHRWARQIAAALKKEGIEVLLIDINRQNVSAARLEGLRAMNANILTQDLAEDLDLDGIGMLMAMTPNDEVNSLAALHFAETFGRGSVYQLTASEKAKEPTPGHLRGRTLFDSEMTYQALSKRFASGAEVKVTKLTDQFDMKAYRAAHGESAMPLFLVHKRGRIEIVTAGGDSAPGEGEKVIGLVDAKRSETPETSR